MTGQSLSRTDNAGLVNLHSAAVDAIPDNVLGVTLASCQATYRKWLFPSLLHCNDERIITVLLLNFFEDNSYQLTFCLILHLLLRCSLIRCQEAMLIHRSDTLVQPVARDCV